MKLEIVETKTGEVDQLFTLGTDQAFIERFRRKIKERLSPDFHIRLVEDR